MVCIVQNNEMEQIVVYKSSFQIKGFTTECFKKIKLHKASCIMRKNTWVQSNGKKNISLIKSS